MDDKSVWTGWDEEPRDAKGYRGNLPAPAPDNRMRSAPTDLSLRARHENRCYAIEQGITPVSVGDVVLDDMERPYRVESVDNFAGSVLVTLAKGWFGTRVTAWSDTTSTVDIGINWKTLKDGKRIYVWGDAK